MNKFFKFLSFVLVVVLVGFAAGFSGSVIFLTSKKINLPFLDSFDIEKLIPQKNVIIEKTEQVYVNHDSRLQEVYKNTKDSMVYVAIKNTTGVYSKLDVLNSGFVFTSDGWIFTNNQSAFDKNKKYVVILNDGKYYDVESIIFDKYDFVLLKINNQKMLVSSFGSYSDINVGSIVFSNNGYNGLDIDYIKNKLDGSIELLNNKIDNVCIFDLSGKIVGVYGAFYTEGPKKYGKSESIKNTKIYSTEYLKNVIYSINAKSDYIIRPNFNGVVFSEFGEVIGSDEKIEKGIYVKTVDSKNSYGFLVGDLITEINNVAIDQSIDFIMQNYKVGDKVKFMIIRNGKQIVNNITLN